MEAADEARLLRDSHLVGMDEEFFGFDPEERDPDTRGRLLREANLLMGVMWHASVTAVDDIFNDVNELMRSQKRDWYRAVENSQVLSDLPERFWHRIGPVHAKAFAVEIIDLTNRISRGWRPLNCVAQELMLRALFNAMEVVIDLYEVPVSDYWRASLEETLFEDLDHEFLYSRSLDGFENDPDFGPPGMAPANFESWFQPFNPERRMTPYSENTQQ